MMRSIVFGNNNNEYYTYLLQKQLTSTSLVQFKFALALAKQLDTVKKRKEKRMSQPHLFFFYNKKKTWAYHKLELQSNSEIVLN